MNIFIAEAYIGKSDEIRDFIDKKIMFDLDFAQAEFEVHFIKKPQGDSDIEFDTEETSHALAGLCAALFRIIGGEDNFNSED